MNFVSLSSCPRIIPTRQGTSLCVSAREQRTADHPHIQGNKKNSARNRRIASGSSPHSGNKLSDDTALETNCGSSPRWGTNREFLFLVARQSVHPYTQGNKVFSHFLLIPVFGSSPPTRNKEFPTTVESATPPDHPHTRGNKFSAATALSNAFGSSLYLGNKGSPAGVRLC